jgi:hypothetical protein
VAGEAIRVLLDIRGPDLRPHLPRVSARPHSTQGIPGQAYGAMARRVGSRFAPMPSLVDGYGRVLSASGDPVSVR